MTKKENSNGVDMGLGEISTIRDILMGQQMSEYSTRFDEIQRQIESVEGLLNQKLASLEQKTTEQIGIVRQDLVERFYKLEKLLQQNTKEINEKRAEELLKQRREFGQILGEMSERLLK